MAQVFHRAANTVARASIAGLILLLVLASGLLWVFFRGAYTQSVEVIKDQPAQFSHKHHVNLGIDCRYCHTTVETSAFAGLPPTETCMSCHSQIWTHADMLEPVRASLAENRPLQWTRVNWVPDYVYFNHSIHINKGIGCESCHGRVDRMPLVWRAKTLLMEFCLECHRNPEKHIRPREEVFTMGYQPKQSQSTLGPKLVAEYQVRKLTDCYTCHR
ncbi:MAG: cytochrome c3 family protein [Bryobacterales bacterium]|nr:cytochrome c3 family protein [Bryobacterales bacterium]